MNSSKELSLASRVRKRRLGLTNSSRCSVASKSSVMIGTNTKFLLLLFCCWLLLWTDRRHATTVVAWKFRSPRGRRGENSSIGESSNNNKAPLADDGASAAAEAATNINREHSANTADTKQGAAESDDSGWFSWTVASAAASADEEVVAEAFQATDAAAAASPGDFRGFVIPPRKAVLDALKNVYQRFIAVVVYKPPVGFVALVAAARLVVSGRIFRFYYQSFGSKEDVEFLQQRQQEQYRKKERSEKHRGRSLTLSADDASYSAFGGVERVRRRLCLAALSSIKQNQPADNSESTFDPRQDLIEATIEALQVTARPTGSCLKFVYEMVEPVARMEAALANNDAVNKLKKFSPYSSSEDECGISPDQLNQLLALSAMTTQVRITDAVVRVCRDRVLQTTYRLARTVEYWQRRVKRTRQMKRMFQKLFRSSIEEDRMRLSLAKATYTGEVARLGEITALLMERPTDMDETAMIQALKSTENRSCGALNIAPEHLDGQPKRVKLQSFVSKWTKPVLSKYSFRWKADGKGLFSIRKYEEKDGYIDGPAAVEALMGSTDEDDWMVRARDWTSAARKVVCKSVRETLQGSTSTGASSSSFPSIESTEQEFAVLQDQWCANRSTVNTDNEQHKQWKSILLYVNSLPSWRRIGEGKSVKLQDVLGVLKHIHRLDFLGIPSSLLFVYAANVFHERLVKPHGATIRKEAENLSKKALEILQQRVWVPMKGIYDDILNKSPRMMSNLGLDSEETSLDHMLRDLGFGDGTPSTRKEALQKATDQYEHDVSSGLFTNFIKGRLVKLLLVQVQQLKVGLLSAIDTIDVLLQGNRIFFYVLAAIPAIVIANVGTRYFARSLYNIRAKDVRPVTVVHSEMGNFLNQLENVLLLSDNVDLSSAEARSSSGETSRLSADTTQISRQYWATKLSPFELGEFTLNMHRYLILLDFSSPPFRAKDCDQIHSSLQRFLGTNGTLKRLDGERNLIWLRQIKQKNQDLVKQL